jgi:hypothetical protein
VTALPLYHIFSLTSNFLTFLKLGGHNVLIVNPRDFPGFVRGAREAPFHLHQRRQYAVQRAAAHEGLPKPSISVPCA